MDKKSSVISLIIAVLCCITVLGCAVITTGALTKYKLSARGSGLSATGSASCDFESDTIVWRGVFSAYGYTSSEAYNIIKNDAKLVKNYLESKNVSADEMTFSSVDISTHYESEYDAEGNYVGERASGFDLSQNLTLSSNDIDKIENISRDISSLIESGVQFISYSPEYYCTKLNEVKLDLIQKATENARTRIQIMADNSGCQPGELLTANLGVFQITAANSSTDDYSYGGCFDTSSRFKTASITVKLNYSVK